MKTMIELISILISLIYEHENKYFHIEKINRCNNMNDVLTLIHDMIISKIMYKEIDFVTDVFYCKLINKFIHYLNHFYSINSDKQIELIRTYQLLSIYYEHDNNFDRPVKEILHNLFINCNIEYDHANKVQYYEHEIKDIIQLYKDYNCD